MKKDKSDDCKGYNNISTFPKNLWPEIKKWYENIGKIDIDGDTPPKVLWPGIKALCGVDYRKLSEDNKCTEYVNWEILKKSLDLRKFFVNMNDDGSKKAYKRTITNKGIDNKAQLEKNMYFEANDIVGSVGESTNCSRSVTDERYVVYKYKGNLNMHLTDAIEDWVDWISGYYQKVKAKRTSPTIYWRSNPTITETPDGKYQVFARLLITDKPVLNQRPDTETRGFIR